MDSTKQQPDDDGVIHIQRLNPGQVDVVLGSHPRRRPAEQKTSRPYGLVIICLAFAGLVYWLGSSLLAKPAPATIAASLPPPSEASSTSAIPASEPVTTEPPRSALRLASYVAPPTAAQAQPQPVSVQPLDNCIKDGNVIDESVLNCRFGQAPRPASTEPPKGMVSDRYMADFKSAASRKEEQRPSKAYTIATMSIREWDGSDRYRAQWRIYDNRIDQDSVCGNFLSGSAERRECRKSAQVHFKDLCREWSKRAARDRDDKSTSAEQRYCEVASSFSP
jgi:hypothetical protein